MHFAISGLVFVLCRGGCGDQGGINGGADFEQQAFAGEQLIDAGQYLLCQLVLRTKKNGF